MIWGLDFPHQVYSPTEVAQRQKGGQRQERMAAHQERPLGESHLRARIQSGIRLGKVFSYEDAKQIQEILWKFIKCNFSLFLHFKSLEEEENNRLN